MWAPCGDWRREQLVRIRSEYWRGETLTVTRPHSINITRYTRYDHMTDWQWMEWGGFLCRTFVMLVCNLHIVIFLLCLYQHCLISWNSTTHLFIKHNQFVWCNHNIPELRILAYSTTHHLWFSFPLFPGTNTAPDSGQQTSINPTNKGYYSLSFIISCCLLESLIMLQRFPSSTDSHPKGIQKVYLVIRNSNSSGIGPHYCRGNENFTFIHSEILTQFWTIS